MMKHLQKLGSALMLPVATLPICGILMGLGYAFAPAVMGAAGATEGFMYALGLFLVKAGGALIDNMAILFAIGTAVGLAKENNGTAGLAGLVSWLMMTTLIGATSALAAALHIELSEVQNLAYAKIANPFTGILAGVLGGVCYNKFWNTKLPDFLAFFSGKRFVAIATGLVSIAVSAILMLAWPVIFSALVAVGNAVVSMDAIGAGIYAFLNRLLIPFGLHHALNNVFWFDTIGLGDLTAYWGGLTEADTA